MQHIPMTPTEWLTLALVIITAFYAWATFRILRANERVVEAMDRQTEAQLRPYVVVAPSVRVGTTLVCLVVHNTGKSPALNVRLSMDRDFFPHARREEQSIAKLSAFTQPIESFAPGLQLVFILGVGGVIFAPSVDDTLCPTVFKVSAAYEHAGKVYAETTTVDLRPMLHSTVVPDPIATELERLRQALERIPKERG